MINTKALTAGINELQLSASNVIVYPNPANTVVNIALPNNAIAENIELVDVNGRVVAHNSNANSINVGNIARGVYIVRISNKEFTLQKQVVLVD